MEFVQIKKILEESRKRGSKIFGKYQFLEKSNQMNINVNTLEINQERKN